MTRTRLRTVAVTLFALVTACSDPNAPAPLTHVSMAYIEREVSGSTQSKDLTDMFRVILTNAEWDQFGNPVLALFYDLSFSPGDERTRITIESDEDDPGFSGFRDHLTDSQDRLLFLGMRFPAENGGLAESGKGDSESDVLVPLRGVEAGPGFEGLNIERFTLTIERLRVVQRDATWIDFDFKWRFDVFVPVD